MAKNLKEFIQCGRDPAYLKNGDIITEELAWEVVGQEGYADGCLDQEFEITQSHIVEDIIGGEGVYETIYRESPDHPWQYIGLCAAGKDKNLAPIHAKTTYVCSKYRAKKRSGTAAAHQGRRGSMPEGARKRKHTNRAASLLAKIPG